MKLLQQLFGSGLSLFGRSRRKTAVANSGSGSTDGLVANKASNVACRSNTRPQSVIAADVIDNDVFGSRSPHSDKPEIKPSSPRLPLDCWSPQTNRICWGSPSARRSVARRGVAAAELEDDEAKLPRSRSLIRTNPWLPPSSPPADRHHFGLRRSPSPAPGSVSCPSTPADSSTESGRRWYLMHETASGGGGSGREEGTTPVASEGYCSVSSLCTMSDSTTVSTAACSDDMQVSVDSLASLFPTLMSSSSTSVHDDKTGGCGALCDSIVDSGIVTSTTSIVNVDVDSPPPVVHDGEIQHKELDFDVVRARSTDSDRSSDCGTPTNQYKTTSSASAATVARHLNAVKAVLDRGNAEDYEFDADVFPFGSELSQKPGAQHVEKRADLTLQPAVSSSRGVEEISSSLAASVERLRRGRLAVDGAFGRALDEERRRQRELTRLRRRMVEAQRDVLLGTLRDLRRDLDDQCRRLQAAYDTVLTARWPRLHADTVYTTSTALHPLPSMCQSTV